MKHSLITPTHNPRFLATLDNSIQRQTHDDWEWIILANGGVTREDVLSHVSDDPRVKVLEYEGKIDRIGFLKKAAFSQGTGDILVEMDHDDILMSNCLEELDKAFQDPDIGFVYSNDAKLTDDFVPYNPAYGWEYRKIKYSGLELTEMLSFPPSAAALSYIWYCPDHVRAWRKEVYEKVGGYDANLSICDDHDLLVRTYLHTKFKHINECLYIYRIAGDNTWIMRNKDIQKTTREIHNKNIFALAERDYPNLMKIDLGGGINKREGYISIDLHDGDINCDLNKGIPLDDNSVGVINASHILEHLHDKHKIMSEMHRVLVDGGWAFIDVPSTDGRGAWMDPTHVSYWNENSFMYYTRKAQAQFIRNDIVRFQDFRVDTIYPGEWWRDNHIPVVRANLRAVKSDKRRPHLLDI